MRSHLNFSFELLENAYEIPDDILSKLRKKYDIDDYIERLVPIIDSQFTIEEMQKIMEFYSSEIGKKILDQHFLQTIDKVGAIMISQIEQDFAINDKGNYSEEK